MSALLELPAGDLLGRFGDDAPTPGGGSAAALAGALASRLAAMVGGLTEGKKGYEEAQGEARELTNEARELATALARAVDEDARSFDGVMAAMQMPKETDEQKAARREAMQAAFKEAARVPLHTAQLSLRAGKAALRLLAIGNKNAATDAGVAVLLAVTGGEGALLNVAVNLGAIKDETWLNERRAEIAPLWLALAQLRTDVWPALAAAGLEIPR